MAISKKEYTIIKEIILAHSTYTWCSGHCIPLADTNAVMQSLDNVFADALKVEREPKREIINIPSKAAEEVPKTPPSKKKQWFVFKKH